MIIVTYTCVWHLISLWLSLRTPGFITLAISIPSLITQTCLPTTNLYLLTVLLGQMQVYCLHRQFTFVREWTYLFTCLSKYRIKSRRCIHQTKNYNFFKNSLCTKTCLLQCLSTCPCAKISIRQIFSLYNISISLVGTAVSKRGSLLWEEAGVPEKNPSVQAGNHHDLSYTTTVHHGGRTRVAAVIS